MKPWFSEVTVMMTLRLVAEFTGETNSLLVIWFVVATISTVELTNWLPTCIL